MPNGNPYGKSLKVNLKTQDFNKVIWDQGIKVVHEKTTLCPSCYNVDSNHYDINCKICQNGKLHYTSKEVWILFYQKKMEEMFQVQGVWELGDVLATFPSIYEDKEVVRIDYGDRVTLVDFVERTSDLVTRASSGDIDSPRYVVKDVEILRTKTVEYNKDVHFQISDGNIEWIHATRPAAGEVYTLAYMYPPVYRVVNFFHEQRYYYDGRKQPEGVRIPTYMPIQAQLRRDYIIDERKGYD